MVFVIKEMSYTYSGDTPQRASLRYTANQPLEMSSKEFKGITEKRNKEHFKGVIESIVRGESTPIAVPGDKGTWMRLGAGVLHLLHFGGKRYIAVPRYDPYHTANPNKLSLCSGHLDTFGEVRMPEKCAMREGFEELLFVLEKDQQQKLLLPAGNIAGREAALAAAKSIGLEATPMEVPVTPFHQNAESVVIKDSEEHAHPSFYTSFNFTNNSCNLIQVMQWQDKDFMQSVGEVTLDMLKLYTFEQTKEGKRILRFSHIIPLPDKDAREERIAISRDPVREDTGPIAAISFDPNGLKHWGGTFFNPTASLETVIAKIQHSRHWTGLLRVDPAPPQYRGKE